MKWFFAITEQTLSNDPDHGFIDCIRVAVQSAKENTTLIPHMVFDGQECEFTREMREAGVKVIFHRLHFYDRLLEAQKKQKPEWPNYMMTAAGAFMRLELPLLEKEDKFVLYTDCDVMFLRDPCVEFCRPEIFAACGQFNQQDYYVDMNSGVMVINLERMGNDLPAMVDFLCDNLYHVSGYDQELLRIFYNANWSPLSARFNWKPYWGVNDDATIVHFHAGKPQQHATYWMTILIVSMILFSIHGVTGSLKIRPVMHIMSLCGKIFCVKASQQRLRLIL
ncbi:hypothetical protein GT348_00345 [Aristophania vespae]|uniref:Nucleotide-diphospho-sugar transferase domain-containing protein n=1 Tax=Aristophania vespae TaxID=2697033 RepID=A0A6P1NBR8_9PROT|nr:hypothetical protein [Aristophania vespae]QHI94978.1 hypothetical protein GT348_00345 [Aristophania vespae]